MLEELKKEITIKKLINDEVKIVVDKNSSDFISYPEFIKYFDGIDEIKMHDLIIGINFTYGWMPTIFNFKSNKLNKILIILNSAKNGIRPTESELGLLKKCLNNSLVGTSKLLHFINPQSFSIWDSRIYRYLRNETPHKYRLEKPKLYIEFLSFCDFIIEQPEYDKVHSSMLQKVGHNMSKYRTIDLLMYLNGGNENSRKL